MKALVTMAALLGVIAASPAAAQFYIGASVGKSDLNPSPEDWAVGPPFSVNLDDTDTGWKIFGGYNFTKNFGLEVAYNDFGNYSVLLNDPGFDAGQATVKVTSFAAFLVGRAPLSERFSVFGKLGVSANKADLDFVSRGVTFIPAASESHTKASFAWGVGAAFAVNKNMAIRVEYEDFGDTGRSNLFPGVQTSRSQPHLISVGAQFSF